MELFVLFAQRKERYPGEYGLEAVAVATEHDLGENESYLEAQKAKADADSEYEATAIVRLKVDGHRILQLLRPSAAPLDAEILGS